MSLLRHKPAKNRYLGSSTTGAAQTNPAELIGYKKVVLLHQGSHISFESPTYAVPYGVMETAACYKQESMPVTIDAHHKLRDCTCGFYAFHDEAEALLYPNDVFVRLIRRIMKKYNGQLTIDAYENLIETYPSLKAIIDPKKNAQALATMLGWDNGKSQVVVETVNSGQYVEYKKGYRSQKQRIKTIIVDNCKQCAKNLTTTPAVAFLHENEDMQPACVMHALAAPGLNRYTFDEIAAMITYPKDYRYPKVTVRATDPAVVPATQADLKTTAETAPVTALLRSLRRTYQTFLS